MSINTPVVFFIFNRPCKTARVFEAIRHALPRQLHVVCDGPRTDIPGEHERIAETRRIATAVDWSCELTTDFAEKNLGCRDRVSSGLSGAFDRFERAIILEDDCLPHSCFFRFCEEMLHRYAGETSVMHVGGTNFLPQGSLPTSYYFSRLFHIWGWATWRRAWKHYDIGMTDWPLFKKSKALKTILPDPVMRSFWTRTFDLSYNHSIDSWDHQWTYCCLKHGGVSVTPCVNLVANIGFDHESTHTAAHHDNPAPQSFEIAFPLTHPPKIEWNDSLDRRVQHSNFPRNFGSLKTLIDRLRGL